MASADEIKMGAHSGDCVTLEVEIECALDTAMLTEVEWFMLAGGTPRKDRSHRRNKTKAWRFVDLCAWIGRKVSPLEHTQTHDLITYSFEFVDVQ